MQVIGTPVTNTGDIPRGPPHVAVRLTGFRGDAHELVMEPLPNAPGKIQFSANNPRYENMSVFHSYTVSEVLKSKTVSAGGDESDPLFCIITHTSPVKVRFTVRFTVLSDVGNATVASNTTVYSRQALDIKASLTTGYTYFQTLAPIAQQLLNVLPLLNPARHQLRALTIVGCRPDPPPWDLTLRVTSLLTVT